MLCKNGLKSMAVLVALAAGVLLLACDSGAVPSFPDRPLHIPSSGATAAGGGSPITPSVCGLLQGHTLGTGSGNGINDRDLFNATGNCLKIVEILELSGNIKWFTNTPSLNVMNKLHYKAANTAGNSGDTYADVSLEDGTYGPSGWFARFRQDGAGATTGTHGQYDRWCKKLATLNFAGKANWRRATAAELTELYKFLNKPLPNHPAGMYHQFGWATGSYYWTEVINSSWALRPPSSGTPPAGGDPHSLPADVMNPRYVSCVAQRP